MIAAGAAVGEGGIVSEVSPGEVGGIFAGVVAVLALFGGGIKWLLSFLSDRQAGREAKLDKWHTELMAREAKISHEEDEYRREVALELADLRRWRIQAESEQAALKTGYQLLATALRTIDPNNQALRMADELLRHAFPPDPMLPASMQADLAHLDSVPSVAPPKSGRKKS